MTAGAPLRNDAGQRRMFAPALRALIRCLRGGAFLTHGRLVIAAWFLLAVEILLLTIVVATTHGAFGPEPNPSTTDFLSFYAAGHLVDAGTPALVYDHAAHGAAEQAVADAAVPYIYFYYPPVYLLLCALLPLLPYLGAFVAAQTVTLLFCLVSLQKILRCPKWTTMLALISFPPAFWALAEGQNAFLSAALFASATLLIDRRPVTAGLLFGILCYKPHFGLMIPVALLAGRRWRAVLGAGAAAAGLCAASAALFGADIWRAYFDAMTRLQSVYATGHLDFAAFISPFGAARALGVTPKTAYFVQAIGTVIAAVAVTFVWRRRLSLPVRAAVLAAATPIAVPVALIYDLMLSAVAMAWLVRAGQERGFAGWHRLMLTLLFVWPLVALNLDPAFYTLAPPATACGTLILAMLTAWREMSTAAIGHRTRAAVAGH